MSELVHRPTKLNSEGMISITVALVFIMVISMTVLGYSQVTRRNNAEALDRQLSSQAYYAAETGINDARNTIAKLLDERKPIPEQLTCDSSESSPYTKNGGKVHINDGDESVEYTCLIVRTQLDDQTFNNLNGDSIVFPLNNTTGDPLGSNLFEWKPAEGSTASVSDCPSPTKNVSNADWVSDCRYALLRVDIMKVDSTTLASAAAAARETMTIFLYPRPGNVNSPPSYPWGPDVNIYGGASSQGLARVAACDTNVCRANISGMGFANAFVRVQTLYQDSPTFRVSADVGQTYSYGQVEIDATGKAQDVLRRVQIRASMTGGSSRTDQNSFSDYAIQSACTLYKRYYTSPNVAGQDGTTSNIRDTACP